ncbi:phage tail protein [Pseudomonas sp. CCUG 57209]|uniref:phage tail assembly chaperone n=1 Tax=Pseudomonas sivasensis TaxID=1880678 RepID=UPI0015EC48F7|nr:phage tail assembly chaperone [Pseudomonas sivasensis]MBA2929895.1 phage tail protein [Pseudomonas sivasensis]
MTIWAKWLAEDQRFLFLPRGSDGVEITEEEHAALLQGQADGQVIASDERGYPKLIVPPAPSPDLLAAVERAWRDEQLAQTDGVVSRHRDELEDGVKTTLTPEQYTDLQAYRRALRSWPEAGEFPLIEHRPSVPSWLAGRI